MRGIASATAAMALLVSELVAGCSGTPVGTEVDEPTARSEVVLSRAVLVAQNNGVASLAGTLTNNSRQTYETTSVQARRGPHQLQVYASTGGVTLFPGTSAPVGDAGLAYVVRGVRPGQTVHVTVSLDRAAPVVLDVPVVAFGPKYRNHLVTFPGPPPTITDGRIVVRPGRKRAYVGYTIDGNGQVQHGRIEDVIVTGPNGGSIDWKHQTATGGPADIVALDGPRTEVPATEEGADADYVDAAAVKAGQTVQVSFEFPTGIVQVPFRVVAG